MSEQPSEERHTPRPWRWGFWKFKSATEDYVFCPVSEAEAEDDLILGCGEYGDRSGVGWFGGAETVLCATAHDITRGGDATLCINIPDMALIAAAPETAAQRDQLLAACEQLVRVLEGNDKMIPSLFLAVYASAQEAIAQTKETDR